MERVSGKTMDAFVEFVSLEEAMKTVERLNASIVMGRVPKLGGRNVGIDLSSQTALMANLFPNARGIQWNGVSPEIKPDDMHEPWNNFKGFVTEEEMVMLVKHVEMPQRVSIFTSLTPWPLLIPL